jgi:hypothetical protein
LLCPNATFWLGPGDGETLPQSRPIAFLPSIESPPRMVLPAIALFPITTYFCEPELPEALLPLPEPEEELPPLGGV